MGGELKNTFCLLKDGRAILSQHMGDLEDAAHPRRLPAQPRAVPGPASSTGRSCIAVDQHPDYLSTRLGREHGARDGLPLVAVQHHHAHIAACLAEHGMPLGCRPVLGIVLDGLGFGEDGTIWGGEFLLADYARLQAPGASSARADAGRRAGDARALAQHLGASARAFGWERRGRAMPDARARARICETRPLDGFGCDGGEGPQLPPACSCGRLFDAVAAALGVCRERVTHEGQAAIELEALIDGATLRATGAGYPFALVAEQGRTVLDSAPLWPALLDDLARAVPPAVIAARFHLGLAAAIVDVVAALSGRPLRGGGAVRRRVPEPFSVRARERRPARTRT